MSSRDETESCGTHGAPEGHPGIPRKRPSLQEVVTIPAAGSPRTFPCARLAPSRTAPHPSEQVLLLSLCPRPSQGTGLRTGDLTQAILLDSLSPLAATTDSGHGIRPAEIKEGLSGEEQEGKVTLGMAASTWRAEPVLGEGSRPC